MIKLCFRNGRQIERGSKKKRRGSRTSPNTLTSGWMFQNLSWSLLRLNTPSPLDLISRRRSFLTLSTDTSARSPFRAKILRPLHGQRDILLHSILPPLAEKSQIPAPADPNHISQWRRRSPAQIPPHPHQERPDEGGGRKLEEARENSRGGLEEVRENSRSGRFLFLLPIVGENSRGEYMEASTGAIEESERKKAAGPKAGLEGA